MNTVNFEIDFVKTHLRKNLIPKPLYSLSSTCLNLIISLLKRFKGKEFMISWRTRKRSSSLSKKIHTICWNIRVDFQDLDSENKQWLSKFNQKNRRKGQIGSEATFSMIERRFVSILKLILGSRAYRISNLNFSYFK